VRIIFFGTPAFAVPSFKALLDSGEDILSVVTQPDRMKGRGHALSESPVKEFAGSKGIPVLQPADIKSPYLTEKLKKLRPDAIVVVAYGKILPLSILKIPTFGCINVHASLLPKYRGAAPIQWALIQGEVKTGVTTMLLDEGLDTGDLLLHEEAEIWDEDTTYSLGIRLSEMGASLLCKTLKGVKDGSVQPSSQTGEPTYAPPLKKDDGVIKWSLPAKKIFNLIRGTYPWPGAYGYLNKERVTIIKSRVIDSAEGAPGRIEKVSKEGVSVGTGRGFLSLIEVKPEGKRSMPASAFAHGRDLKRGVYFDSP
jgi:methionyl-tRNA formyltransferase